MILTDVFSVQDKRYSEPYTQQYFNIWGLFCYTWSLRKPAVHIGQYVSQFWHYMVVWAEKGSDQFGKALQPALSRLEGSLRDGWQSRSGGQGPWSLSPPQAGQPWIVHT